MTTLPNKMARLFAFLSALIITGCAATPQPDPASGINRATGRIAARAESIGEQAGQIESAPIGTPIESVKPLATSIRTQAGWIGVDVDEADKHVDELSAINQRQHDEIIEIKSSFGYRAWKWVRRFFWAIVISGSLFYVGAGLLAIFLPIRWPISGLKLSYEIVRAVPLMNWAAWIRDRLIGRAGK